VIIERAGRQLIQIESEEEWDKLPKDVRALPVYFRKTATGIDLWPMYPDYYPYPSIRVEP
jgi:hypothetical protein